MVLLDNDTQLPRGMLSFLCSAAPTRTLIGEISTDLYIPVHWMEENASIQAFTFTIRAANLRKANVSPLH